MFWMTQIRSSFISRDAFLWLEKAKDLMTLFILSVKLDRLLKRMNCCCGELDCLLRVRPYLGLAIE